MITAISAIDDPANWVTIPGGNKALYRHAYNYQQINQDERFSLATDEELIACMYGYPFPWGRSNKVPENWENEFRGITGLYHHNWYITDQGNRLGGAWNVNREGSGSLRHLTFSPSSVVPNRPLEANEGYAIAKSLDQSSKEIYHRLQIYAARHINVDGGILLCSPVFESNKIYIGLGGMCRSCLNREDVTLPQLQEAFPNLGIIPFPDMI